VARRIERGHRIDLPDQARTWPPPNNWRSPDSNSRRGGAVTPESRKAGGHSVNLQDQAVYFRPDLPTSAHGAKFSDVTPRLNPRFVEHLMGLPLGWTDSGYAVTASFRLWQLTHSEALRVLLSRTVSTP
jgi:hypothetical protein